MRDPYLYEEVNVLKNRANIKDHDLLRRAEADIANCAMSGIYERIYDSFDVSTIQDIHKCIFGQIYDWAGEFRTIYVIKPEDVLGGDTVRYAYPNEIKKQLTASVKELKKLKRTGDNDRDIVFRLIRIIAQIWQTHPFREGNTRTVVVFATLFARSLGFDVKHELFKEHSSYVRNALVWASQGIYSKYEYLENIFFDAILHDRDEAVNSPGAPENPYEAIGDYRVKDYKERPHEYREKY